MTPTALPAELLPADPLALIAKPAVKRLTGLEKSAIHERVAADKFPRPLRLSSRCSRWRAGDLRRWLADPLGWSPAKAIDIELAERDAAGGA